MKKQLLKLGAKQWEEEIEDQLNSSVIYAQNPIVAQFDFEKDNENYIKQIQASKTYKQMEIVQKPDFRILDYKFISFVKNPKGENYKVTLIKVNIRYGQYSANLFYRMSIVYHNLRKVYILFTNWGRIGTLGQFQCTPFYNKDQCVKEFQAIFFEKTKNHYKNRDNFVKHNKKYRYIKQKKRYNYSFILQPINMNDRRIPASRLDPFIQRLL